MRYKDLNRVDELKPDEMASVVGGVGALRETVANRSLLSEVSMTTRRGVMPSFAQERVASKAAYVARADRYLTAEVSAAQKLRA